ncbi:MAG: TetR/AcrR family transcriptional regulator [Paracoccaceae bacterium]
MTTQRLSSLDWIQAGFRALLSGGEGAVRAEPLARELGVSKGSFYWHFKSVADLHNRMIDHWETAATATIIDMVEQGGGSARHRLSALMDLVMSDLDAPYGGPLAEISIRDWAQRAEFVARSQERVDAARLAYLSQLFERDGVTSKQAEANARLTYSTYIGAASLPTAERAATVQHLLTLLDLEKQNAAHG